MTDAPTPRRAPTMRDVADHASVSPMTVSRVLHDDPRVSGQTRERVLASVDALGYRRNEVARNLRLGHTSGLIGLVVTNLANPFYSQLALGVESVAGQNGLKVVLTNTDEDVGRERRLVEELTARRVDGMIVVPAGSDHSHLDPQTPGSVPVVLGARPPTNLALDCVLVDDFGGAREATAGLLAAGHTRVGFLGLPPSVWTSSERFRGFCVALEEAGVGLDERYVRLQQRTIPAAEDAARELLRLRRPPTALFCANSRNTLGAYRAATRLGVDVELAGFDDFELADVLGVPLIVAYDPRELGRRAAELLMERMSRTDTEPEVQPRRIVVPTTVVRYGNATR
ncbi:LacI family DNA-binding transcriptional regulator [Actinopolymorpha sp. B17G11]|uniref:LacI family DNA-binding transcriptional regulator n=1 Tax=unclassified Actinopolymorpha TaxID=2627063 RepID=UPI0032D935C8